MARGRSQIAAEVFALGVVLLLLVALPAGIFGYQAWRTASAGVRVVEIVAHAPERGGFTPDRLSLKAGETVRLRICDVRRYGRTARLPCALEDQRP